MINIKTDKEIQIMAQGGKILSRIIKQLQEKVEPGITTNQLNELAEELIFNSNAKPAFKNYKGFPKSLCVAINEQIVHGIPSDTALQQGDIISLDLGLNYNGYCTDMAVTVPVGAIDPEAGRLLRVTKKSLKRAIARCKPGKTLGDIGQAIQTYIESQGFQVVRELCGHGIGKQVHEDPEVLNFGQRHKGLKLEQNMVIAIEPMAVMGKPGIKKGPDGYSYQTIDKSLSAHFEHTIVITSKGGRVLTK